MAIINPDEKNVKAKSFVAGFTPYRRRCISKKTDEASLFSTWKTDESYLTDVRIEAAIEGRALYGYFLATTPKAFAVDIDDHRGRGEGHLLGLYRDTVARLGGVYPSILNRSPRGLHAHYFLTDPMPQTILIEGLAERVRGLPVDIRPTAKTGLRMPTEGTLIDPENYLPLRANFVESVRDAERYHPAILLGDAILPGEMRARLRERKDSLNRLKQAATINRVEERLGCIEKGTTNDALCAIIPLYRQSGLEPDEAAARFASLLSPHYHGELRKWDRLLARVSSFYKGKVSTPYEQGRSAPGLFDARIADAVAGLWTPEILNKQDKGAAVKRRRSLINFTLEIVQWRGYIDGVKKRPMEASAWNYLYPYFKKNIKEGYYPLPRNLLMKVNSHYHRLLPHMIDCGFLERSPYQYSPEGGICYYYRINDGAFL